MCPGFCGKENILSSIRIWEEEIDELQFNFLLSSKEEVEMDEPLLNSPKKEQGGLLIIDGNFEVV